MTVEEVANRISWGLSNSIRNLQKKKEKKYIIIIKNNLSIENFVPRTAKDCLGWQSPRILKFREVYEQGRKETYMSEGGKVGVVYFANAQ